MDTLEVSNKMAKSINIYTKRVNLLEIFDIYYFKPKIVECIYYFQFNIICIIRVY